MRDVVDGLKERTSEAVIASNLGEEVKELRARLIELECDSRCCQTKASYERANDTAVYHCTMDEMGTQGRLTAEALRIRLFDLREEMLKLGWPDV